MANEDRPADDLPGEAALCELGLDVRVGAPIYLKFGLRNAPGIHPVGRHLAAAVESARERVRRASIGLEVIKREGLTKRGSPSGSRSHGPVERFPGPLAAAR